jgi:apolipoprotein N-acyltransferase
LWPENAVPILLETNATLIDRVRNIAGAAPVLLGAPRMSNVGGRSSLRASAFLVGPAGIIGTYDKRRLLPLAETSGTFGADNLWMAASSADAGSSIVLPTGTLRPTPLICYEAIFADLARSAVQAGANVLVNLSNDAWLARKSGREQHFLFMRLRAVELRRTLVRVANRGVSGIVRPDGTAVLVAQGDGAGTHVVSVPLLADQTTYGRQGDFFAALCSFAVLAALVLSRSSR